MIRKFLSALAGLTLLVCGSSSALVVDTLNDPIPFTISGDIGDGIVLTATGTVMITGGFNTSTLALHVILNNASTLNGDPFTPSDGVILIGWGFGVDPNMTGVTFANGAGGGMIDATPESVPGLGGIEVCAWGGNGCTGNGTTGVLAGTGDSFDLFLDGNWGRSVIFDPVGARFLTSAGIFSFQCTGSCSVGNAAFAAAAVPEPQTLALIGIALLAVGAVSRRRRASAQPPIDV